VPANVTLPIRLISFDLDDTLWDVRPALEAAEAAQWQYLGERYPSLDLRLTSGSELSAIRDKLLHDQPLLAHRISQFREAFIDRLLQSKGIDPPEAGEAAAAAFAAFYAKRHSVAVYADAPAILKELGQHFLVGALTNGNADVNQTSIGSCFDFAWRAEQFGVSKPDPALFHEAFRTAGVAPQEVIHVGDCHHNDVSGAINAGAQAIWYNPEGGTSDTANAVIQRLSELPDAIADLAKGMTA
jgi:HAD superfamily hydrolase (TIGR01509 family)